jgi:lipopolysaccharide transport system ATP-binding protein
MLNNTVLCVSNLSKCYRVYDKPRDRLKQAISFGKKQYHRDFWALRDINLEVKKGEVIGIIGRNGSGKSTLLQLICQTLTPTSGHIEVNGRIAALLELGAGFNPQFTGRENVYINGAILGFNRKEIDMRFANIEAFADIGNFIDQPVKSYSSGMFVRLAFAVQACVNPDILIIDEALAVGDVFFRQKCYQLLSELQQRGVAIILVTHAMNEVEQFCHRALLLKHGKALFLGPASEAVKRYYVAEQETRGLIKENRNPVEAIDYKALPLEDFFWPATTAFLNISQVPQVTNDWAICTGVAICDHEGNVCQAYQQGDTASFFYEFKLLHDIDVPTTGIVIQNDRNIIVHGKSSIEYGSQVPQRVKSGEILRVRQDICLELAMGDYTFEIGLAAMTLQDYSQRKAYRYQELYAIQTRLCHLPNVGQFSILPRSHAAPVQLLHHGIANLPGRCNLIKLTSAIENYP